MFRGHWNIQMFYDSKARIVHWSMEHGLRCKGVLCSFSHGIIGSIWKRNWSWQRYSAWTDALGDVKRKQLGASYFPRCWDLRFPQLIRSVFRSIRRRASDRGISLSKPWRSYYEIAIITVEPSPWPGNSTSNSATSIQKYRLSFARLSSDTI